MTGWRLGYMVAPRNITERVIAIHSHLVTGACTFAQRAAALALRDDRTERSIRDMVSEYQVRRDIVVSQLEKIDGISCLSPKGTFYAFPNISELGLTPQESARELLSRTKVAVVPGNSFGPHGEGFIRLSFATARERLEIALDRIQRVMAQFQRSSAAS